MKDPFTYIMHPVPVDLVMAKATSLKTPKRTHVCLFNCKLYNYIFAFIYLHLKKKKNNSMALALALAATASLSMWVRE